MGNLARRAVTSVLCALIVLAFSVTLAPTEAEAQMERRSGAGTMKQSNGAERRGNANRDGKRGGSRMSSTRTSSRNLDDDDDDYDEDDDDDSNYYGKSKKKKSSYDDDDDDEEEEVDFGARTLGRACMYGASGEVIFRPEGSLCRGDAPTTSEARKATKNRKDRRAGKSRSRSNGRAKDRANRGAASSSHPAAKDSAADEAKSKPKSRGGPCMYDGKGKVIYAPSGATCRGR